MPADGGNRKEDAGKGQSCGSNHAIEQTVGSELGKQVSYGHLNAQAAAGQRVVDAAEYFLKASFWNLGIGEQWNRKCVKDFMPGQCLPYGPKMKESLS